MNRSPQKYRRGFTLVELLVVIGIIALLISILLPVLTRARQASMRTQCSAKLHSVMVAAALHRTDHMDYYPLVGYLLGGTPETLDDAYTQKYDYRNTTSANGYAGAPSTFPRSLAPITVSLGFEMGFRQNMYFTQAQTATATVDWSGLYRSFQCPSQCANIQEWSALEPSDPCAWYGDNPAIGGWGFAGDPSSFIFNEFVLGFDDSFGRLRGHASMVRQAAKTMFACDGVGSSTCTSRADLQLLGLYNIGDGFLTLYNNFPNSRATLPGGTITLADVFTGKTYGGIAVGGDTMCFDLKRHQKQMNIAYCDGHVESRAINANDLQQSFLMAP